MQPMCSTIDWLLYCDFIHSWFPHICYLMATRQFCAFLMAVTFPFSNCKQVPSYEMLGIPKYEEEVPPTPAPQPQHPLSPMGEACSRMDLTAIHQILVNTHYRDDEGTNEVNP